MIQNFDWQNFSANHLIQGPVNTGYTAVRVGVVINKLPDICPTTVLLMECSKLWFSVIFKALTSVFFATVCFITKVMLISNSSNINCIR